MLQIQDALEENTSLVSLGLTRIEGGAAAWGQTQKVKPHPFPSRSLNRV